MPEKVRLITDPVLRKVCETVDVSSDPMFLLGLLETMNETMIAERGIGLAANQIGHPIRVFILKKDDSYKEYINPEITSSSELVSFEGEACLSIPGTSGATQRYRRVSLTWVDRHGIKIEGNFEDMEAFAVQHEMDHLNGMLFGASLVMLYGWYQLNKMKKIKDVLLKQIKAKAAEIDQKKETIKERLLKASDIAQAQMSVRAQMDMPSKNALHSKYKNDLMLELQEMEQQKLDLLRTILIEGYNPMITVLNESGKKTEMPLSEYVDEATGALNASLGAINYIAINEVQDDDQDRLSIFDKPRRGRKRKKPTKKQLETWNRQQFEIIIDFIPTHGTNANNNSSRSKGDSATVAIQVAGRDRCLELFAHMVEQIREQIPDNKFLDDIVEKFIQETKETSND
ncbi:unnamed protein product [Sphagnum balticum]